ncbi:unnamed protein product [Leptosia nina]|uniref:WD repeat-containing protein on Y chromosome n=1 Tax=Leptosia nina TaxID=320188 RepID=A0AAV1JES1_9NEOP
MSIKSQKSLNEECTEIFERSYSIKSASEENPSSDDEEEYVSKELLKKLTPSVLSKLRKCFKRAREKKARDLDKKVEKVMRAAAAEEGIEFVESVPLDTEHLYLNENGFVSALDNILGNPKYKPHAQTLYRAIDRFQTGRVSWSQLVARLVASGARTTASRLDTWSPVKEAGVVRLKHCNRETIVTLISIEDENSFCYVAVSKGGRIGIYTGDLKLLKSYEVFYHRSGVRSRVRNCWITDAAHMRDVSCLVLSASDRSLTIYDVSTLSHTPLYCVTGLPNIPTCLAYCPTTEAGYSELLVGTERGELIRLRFLQPRVSLLHVKVPDTINYYFWMELSCPPHSTYCSIHTCRSAHARSVRRATYVREDILLSCSHDTVVSLRMKYLTGKLDDYEITVHRGVSCFDSVTALRLTVTGSKDGLVRIWTHAQRTPIAKLKPNCAPVPVVDVKIVETENVVLGYYNNCMIHIWDLYEECLLQSVKLKFPFLGVLGKRIEFGTTSIHLGPPRRKSGINAADETGRSRRGSSVFEGSTGGLMLQMESNMDGEQVDSAPLDRSEVLVTCNDSVYILSFRDIDASVVGPACRAVEGRRPSVWDLNLSGGRSPSKQVTPRTTLAVDSDIHLLQPTIHSTFDLDQLIAHAGLENILEKDFVLTRGFKHDLNKKMFEMQSKENKRKSSVCIGAPYLSLPRYTLDPLPVFHHLHERYERVKRWILSWTKRKRHPNGESNHDSAK